MGIYNAKTKKNHQNIFCWHNKEFVHHYIELTQSRAVRIHFSGRTIAEHVIDAMVSTNYHRKYQEITDLSSDEIHIRLC